VSGDGQRRAKYTFASFIGTSPAAVEVKRQARRAAQSGSPVLLLGETGTGKELLAHAIHAASSRASGPFVSVNIAAVPDTLLEAEFFGVAPGAYTGADRKGRDGKFKLADGGTLFLDEIGDMPQSLQAKLLRALQEGEIEPLGSNQLVPFDVRVVAATSRDLGGAGARGPVPRRPVLPPACAAGARAAAARAAQRHPGAGRGAGRRPGPAQRHGAARAAARCHGPAGGQPWRGNIRELRNVLEQAAMRSDSQHHRRRPTGALLREAGVEPAGPRPRCRQSPAPADDARPAPLAEQVAELEQRAIAAALQSPWRQQAGDGAAAGHLARHAVRTSGKP
jgi:transcriptional regulator with PAS, ATPase and Fis domain